MDDELKSVLLERACDQNNSIMVECLLLLGADANGTKEATSLICQVNTQGLTFVFPLLFDSTIVQLLLTSYYSLLQILPVNCTTACDFCRSLDSQNFGGNRVLEVYPVKYFILLVSLPCYVDKQLLKCVSYYASLYKLFSRHTPHSIWFCFDHRSTTFSLFSLSPLENPVLRATACGHVGSILQALGMLSTLTSPVIGHPCGRVALWSYFLPFLPSRTVQTHLSNCSPFP